MKQLCPVRRCEMSAPIREHIVGLVNFMTGDGDMFVSAGCPRSASFYPSGSQPPLLARIAVRPL